MIKIETITFNKRDSDNYEITIHKDFTNLSITKDKEYFISSGSKVFNTCHVQDRDYDEDRNVCKTKEEAEAFLALIQLKRLWHEYVDNYSEKTV